MGNIIRDGVIMLVILSVIFILWLILSTPFNTITASFEDVNATASDAKVEETTGWIGTVWNIFFAGLGTIPIIWFIMRMMQREPDWR